MDTSEIFRIIQKYTEANPLFFVGSGASAAYGLPGMKKLGEHLLASLSSKYVTDNDWKHFEDNIKSGKDLESAMTDIVFKEDIINDIRKETWKLISEKDLEIFSDVVFCNKEIALSRLIKIYYQAHPQKVDIITTNYDRLIEYACDKVRIPLNNGFSGHYSKFYSDSFGKRNIVNLVKVHGSYQPDGFHHQASESLRSSRNGRGRPYLAEACHRRLLHPLSQYPLLYG